MEGRTHMAIGLACGVGLAFASGQTDDVAYLGLTIVVTGIASILPDIDEDGSLINLFLFPVLKRAYRSIALLSLGIILILFYFLRDLPLWVLLTGIFAAGVAYAPHRSVTHSLLALAYVTTTVYLISPSYAFATAVGYFSHLFADTMNIKGVPYLWPYKTKFSFKKWGVQVKAGSEADKMIGTVAIILTALGVVFLVGHIIYEDTLAQLF